MSVGRHVCHPSKREGIPVVTIPDEAEARTTAEVAKMYGVSQRSVERWIKHGLPAHQATPQQVADLLDSQRLKGLPPKGVWLITDWSEAAIAQVRKPVGYPKGKARQASRP